MDSFNNIIQSFTSLPPDRKRLVYILSGTLLLFFIIIGFLSTVSIDSPTTETQVTENGIEPPVDEELTIEEQPKAGEQPKVRVQVTASPEQIVAMTLAPRATDIPFISKDDYDSVIPHYTPTPTPLPGQFYVANGQQNDLEIRYWFRDTGDSFDELRIRNNRTTEEKTIGYMYRSAPGNSAFFSTDFSQVVYIGGTKSDYNKITFYSIPRESNTKYITLDQMKQKLPSLKIDPTAVLSRLSPSPDKSKIAFSYGTTFNANRITPDTVIIVVNLSNNSMKLLPTKGLVKGWKDTTTLEYEVNTTTPSINATQEISVTGI